MNTDENQASQHHFLEQKKYLRQNDVVLKLGSQLVRSGSVKKPIKDLLNTLVKELDYLYVKVTIHGAGSNDDMELDHASDTAVVSQVEKVVARVENEAKRSLTFKMSPIQNRLEVKHSVFKVKRSYDCFAVAKPLLYSGSLLGVISGVKANVGSMNPRAEQTLMTLLSNLISQSIVIEKSGTGLSISS